MVLCYIVVIDKMYYWMVGCYDCMYWDFGFFLLCVVDGFVVGMGGMYWMIIQDYVVYVVCV